MLRLAPTGLVAVLLFGAIPAAIAAPDDPAAALQRLIETCRDGTPRLVRVAMTLQTWDADVVEQQASSEAEFLLLGDRRGRLGLRGFTARLEAGRVRLVHEGTPGAFWETPDDDSPFYTLMQVLGEVPFPHLALGFGEDALDDVCMQMHPRAPWLRPSGLEPGDAAVTIVLASASAEARLVVDDDTGMLRSALIEITGGELAPGDRTLRFSYTCEHETLDEARVEAMMYLDLEANRLVETVAELIPDLETGDGGGDSLVGEPAPDLLLATLGGGVMDLVDLRGRVVVIDFWATWCAPCRKALPALHSVAAWARDETLPVTVLTVDTFERGWTMDERHDKVRALWEEHSLDLPVLMDYNDAAAKAWGVTGIPATFVVRPDGTVHAAHVGLSPDHAAMLRTSIREAMDGDLAPAGEL